MVPLSKCGAKYITALHNPFHPYAAGACVPTALALPSWKFSTLTRMDGEFYAANGADTTLGGVSFYPFRTLYSATRFSSATNARFPALISSCKGQSQSGDYPFSNSSVATLSQIGTSVVISSGSISPFTPSVTSPDQVFARLVGASLRVRYTGNVVGTGGSIVVWRPQYNCSEVPASADNPSDLKRNPQAAWIPLRPGLVVELVYTPKVTQDLDYFPLPVDNAASVETPIQSRLAGLVAFAGVDPKGSFTCEAMAHWEIQGANQPAVTKNSTDVQAMGLAIAANPSGPSSPEPSQRLASVSSNMAEYVRDAHVNIAAAAAVAKDLTQAMNLGKDVITQVTGREIGSN